MQQHFYQLKQETFTLTWLTTANGSFSPGVDAVKADPKKATPKQKLKTNGAIKNNAVQPVPIAQPQNVDKLMEILGNNPQIIRRNDSNKLEVIGHAVLGSNFDQLYNIVLSPRGSKHKAGMTELLGALKQLNVKSKDIDSNLIKAAYESGAANSSPFCHNDNALPFQPPKAAKNKARAPLNKRGSTSPFDIKTRFEAKPTKRSTTKYNTQ